MRLNNISVQELRSTLKAFEKEPQKAKKTNRVEGIWQLEEGKPQFVATLEFEKGKIRMEADQPTSLGGSGLSPGPIQFCLFGLAACYCATFATIAAMENIPIGELKVEVESDVNFAAVFGIVNGPIIEEVRLNLYVRSDAPREEIERVERAALDTCPGIYCMKNPIPIRTELKFLPG